MTRERLFSRAEMMAKPVGRIQMFANRNPYNYAQGSPQLSNRELARAIWKDYEAGKLKIYEDYFVDNFKYKPQTKTTMPKKKKTTTKASATMRKASKIYEEQKGTYQKMLKTKVRQGKKVTVAAKEASKVYKEMYGATPMTRWKRAIREAKHC